LKIYPSVLLKPGYTNPGHQFPQATELCSVVPRICTSSVWSFLHVMFLAPKIFRQLSDFFKNMWTSVAPRFLKTSGPMC